MSYPKGYGLYDAARLECFRATADFVAKRAAAGERTQQAYTTPYQNVETSPRPKVAAMEESFKRGRNNEDPIHGNAKSNG